MLLCRSDMPIPPDQRRKIALFCNIMPERVIAALDVPTIYQVPISYSEQGFDDQVLAYFGVEAPLPDLKRWKGIVDRVLYPEGEVTLPIVGKYTSLLDSYKSLAEALTHGGIANNVRVKLQWLDSELFERPDYPVGVIHHLESAHAILVPGGFGNRGTEGMIRAAEFARTRAVPYLGICFGMQMAVIEAARHIAGLKGAGSTEFGTCEHPIVGLMTEWTRGNALEQRQANGDLGGTMRLGAYDAVLAPGSRVADAYGRTDISERHRHRYEVNIRYKERLEAA